MGGVVVWIIQSETTDGVGSRRNYTRGRQPVEACECQPRGLRGGGGVVVKIIISKTTDGVGSRLIQA